MRKLFLAIFSSVLFAAQFTASAETIKDLTPGEIRELLTGNTAFMLGGKGEALIKINFYYLPDGKTLLISNDNGLRHKTRWFINKNGKYCHFNLNNKRRCWTVQLVDGKEIRMLHPRLKRQLIRYTGNTAGLNPRDFE